MNHTYEVRIVRRDLQQSPDDFHATVSRIADDEQLIFISSMLWLLKWKTRKRALDRAFKRHDKRQRKLAQEDFLRR